MQKKICINKSIYSKKTCLYVILSSKQNLRVILQLPRSRCEKVKEKRSTNNIVIQICFIPTLVTLRAHTLFFFFEKKKSIYNLYFWCLIVNYYTYFFSKKKKKRTLGKAWLPNVYVFFLEWIRPCQLITHGIGYVYA